MRTFASPAEWNSAIRQSATLRYAGGKFPFVHSSVSLCGLIAAAFPKDFLPAYSTEMLTVSQRGRATVPGVGQPPPQASEPIWPIGVQRAS